MPSHGKYPPINISNWDDENLDTAVCSIMRNASPFIRAELAAVMRYVYSDLAAYAEADQLAHTPREQVTRGRWFANPIEVSYIPDWDQAALTARFRAN